MVGDAGRRGEADIPGDVAGPGAAALQRNASAAAALLGGDEAELRQQYARAERLEGAMHAAQPGASNLPRAIEIVDKALSAPGVPVNAVVVFDARHDADAESICDRLGPGTLRGAATAVAAAVAAAVTVFTGRPSR